jgi:formylglycine-generating enzyme required for sulfatase activity
MHANVSNWCQEIFSTYPRKPGETLEDNKDLAIITLQEHRVLRGGAFDYLPVLVRCTQRYVYAPANRDFNVGLRVARTLAIE